MIATLVVLSLVVGACQQAAPPASSGGRIGGTVSVLATWGGSEQDSFLATV